MKKIETYGDLPEYGKYVLVNGIDKKMYNNRGWHVCEMNDLEDGLDYQDMGLFFWLTENGTMIDDVTHWCELPSSHSELNTINNNNYTKEEIQLAIDQCKKFIVNIKTPLNIDGDLDQEIETIESKYFLHNLESKKNDL